MKLHAFPTATDRARIHGLVHLNVCGKLSRVQVDEVITQILFNYGVKHLHLDGYSVRLGEPIRTPIGEWPVIHIEAHRTADGPNCPECGGKPGYLEGDKVIVAGCRNCGVVFKFRDKEVEQGASPQDAG